MIYDVKVVEITIAYLGIYNIIIFFFSVRTLTPTDSGGVEMFHTRTHARLSKYNKNYPRPIKNSFFPTRIIHTHTHTLATVLYTHFSFP